MAEMQEEGTKANGQKLRCYVTRNSPPGDILKLLKATKRRSSAQQGGCGNRTLKSIPASDVD